MKTETKEIIVTAIRAIGIAIITLYTWIKAMYAALDLLDKTVEWIFYRKK